jgi:hypothetical protein
MKVALRVLTVLTVISLALSPSLARAQECTTPRTVFQWVNLGPSSWGTAPISSPTICTNPRAVVDATGATHVYAVDVNSHLLEFFQSRLGAGWTTTDISAQLGINIQGAPNPMFFGGTDIQVYVVANFQLLSLVTTGNSHVFQFFNLTNSSGSKIGVFEAMPMPILVGTTVHIYLLNLQAQLQDYVKPINGPWQDVNLSLITGLLTGNATPYAFGGNSIQIATPENPGNDLLTFIEPVNPAGTIAGSISVFDLTSIAHGTTVTQFPSPLTVGPGNSDVVIFSGDSRGNLVEYFKTQPTQWVERSLAVLGSGGTISPPIYFPTSGPNGTVKIFANVINTAGNGFLFEYDGDPVVGTLSGGPAFAGEGPIFGTPHAVLNNGTVEVFTLN